MSSVHFASLRVRCWAWLVFVAVVASSGCSDENFAPIDSGAGIDGGGATGGGGSGGTAGSGGSAGDDRDSMVSDDGALGDASLSFDAAAQDAETLDAAQCQPPLIATHDSLGGAHVATNAGVVYNSNPPSSGPHCGSWGAYTVYTATSPLARCNYIHNLEHGGVVLLYKCAGECPEIVDALTSVRNAIVDPECPGGKRVILTPDPAIDTLIAAAAWQNTWTSDCATDAALTSLTGFIRDNLGGAGAAPESGICQ